MPLAVLRDAAGAVVRRLRRTPPYDVLNRGLIARFVPGRSFVDVGTMWNVDGAYAFWALDSGARAVSAVDLMPESERFKEMNAARANGVAFHQLDINTRRATDTLGRIDVVFCSGVLYHVPDPIWTLNQLRAVCGSTLILGSSTIPEASQPNSAVFVPFLNGRQRDALNLNVGFGHKIGLDTPFIPSEAYANFYWLFAPSCLRSMLTSVGFRVDEQYDYRRASVFVCTPGA